jgi:allantoate deiminase
MDATTILARCDRLATFSEEPGQITRRFATRSLRDAGECVANWMRAAGMQVRWDSVGNLIGHYPASQPDAPILLIGSHLDSVRDAGRYDGPLGVLSALAVVERLHAAKRTLPFAIEVLGFADEEGLRYHTAYLGSSALAGRFNPDWLSLRDADGISMAEAIHTIGGDPAAIMQAQREPEQLLGYVEVHIEQGPVLEALDLPVGVVTAIAAQHRYSLSFQGVANHAGTTPMHLRADALCAAAEWILAVEDLAKHTTGLVATVGQIQATPGASNVIPGRTMLSLDLRHQSDTTLSHASAALHTAAERIADQRGTRLNWQPVQANSSVPMSPRLIALLSQAVEQQGITLELLPSGAGHDAVMLHTLTETAMLFVRCAGGISHNPAESVRLADVACALEVLSRMVDLLAAAPLHR